MGLLFINALKGLRKKKIQMLAIILMVMLSTGIYTAMNISLDKLENRYYSYLKEQNVEDFSFTPIIDYEKDITKSSFQKLINDLPFITNEEQVIVDDYLKCLDNKSKCNEFLYSKVEGLFYRYDMYTHVASEKIDTVADKYNFKYEVEKAKLLTDNMYITKALIYNPNKQINKPYLLEGRFPKNDNEITVLPRFAKKNNLKIGSLYLIGKKSYSIVGYAYASDHIYPMLSFNLPIFDEKYNNIVFMTSKAYEEFAGLKDDMYVAKFNYGHDNSNRLKISFGLDQENNENIDDIQKININEKDKLSMNMKTAARIMRIDFIKTEFSSNRTFAEAFLYLLLSIAVFIIAIITKKRVEDERLQIGVLKSLGYNSFSIGASYLVYPILGTLLGGTLGYLIGIILNNPLTYTYLSYFNIPLSGFALNIKYIVYSLVIPLIILSILTYIITLIMLKKKPLSLLKEGSNLKVNWFSKLTSKLTSKLKFKQKFKYLMASRSLGKLVIVSLTSLATGMFIILTLIGINLFDDMIDKSFEGMKFEYMVSYSSLGFDSNTEDDFILRNQFKINSILDSENKEKELIKDDFKIDVIGIDKNPHYIKVLDENKNDLTSKLEDDVIIINKNIEDIMKIKKGDTIVLEIGDSKVKYKVDFICDEYIGNGAYVLRNDLSEKMSIPLSYTSKYSNNDKYSNMSNIDVSELSQIAGIFNLQDLKDNITEKMKSANTSLYVVIAFASFMALVIIAVIANIVVEENKKNISLLKVIGYKNKEISQMVLNIYTPFVIIFYLLSIPLTIYLLKSIIKTLVADMNMTIPISLSPDKALIGLIGLLLGYYIAISLSKNILNRISLSIALKRE